MMKLEIFIGLARPNPGNMSAIHDTVSHFILFTADSFHSIPKHGTAMAVKENTMIDNESVPRRKRRAVNIKRVRMPDEETLSDQQIR